MKDAQHMKRCRGNINLLSVPAVHARRMEFVGEAEPPSTKRKGKKQEQQRYAWPPELTTPAPPRAPPALTADRFAPLHRFGDDIQLPEDTRPLPNLCFRNGYLMQGDGQGQVAALSPRLRLPPIIYFYVHLKFQKVPFPFPPGVDTKKFLLKARVAPGEEDLGVVAHVPFDEKHVIGLQRFHLQTFAQLVVVVPSTDTINPRLQATKLSFHPRHSACLHRGTTGGSERSQGLPRILVNVWPKRVSHGAARGRHLTAAASRRVPPPSLWGTFGSSDGRMGPVHRPVVEGHIVPCPHGKIFTRSASFVGAAQAASARSRPPDLEPAPTSNRHAGEMRMAEAEDEESRTEPLAPLAVELLQEATAGSFHASEKRVYRPSFLMA